MPRGITTLVSKGALALVALACGAYAYIFFAAPAFFNRMVLDDFCYAGEGLRQGWIDSQLHWWFSWSGRHFATVLITAFGALAPHGSLAPWSYTNMVLLLGGFFAAGRSVFKLSSGQGALFALIGFASLLALTPQRSESWFWLASSATYLTPLSLALLLLGVVAHSTPSRRLDWLAGLLAFSAVGCSEPFGLLLIGSCLLGLWWLRSGPAVVRRRTLISLGAGLISFLLVLAAPGNQVRMAAVRELSTTLPGSGSLLDILELSLAYGPATLLSVLEQNWLLLVALAASCTTVFALRSPQRGGRRLWSQALAVPVLIFLASMAYAAPSAYARAVPPTRSQLTLAFLLLVGAVWMAWLAFATGWFHDRPWKAPAVALVAAVAAGLTFVPPLRPGFRAFRTTAAYSRAFDRFYDRVLAAPRNDLLVVDPMPEGGMIQPANMTADPQHWINKCAELYFDRTGGLMVSK